MSAASLFDELMELARRSPADQSTATFTPLLLTDGRLAARAALELKRLQDRLFVLGAMKEAPCFFCGYNGPGYFQPKTHPCAERHHRLYPGDDPW